VEVVSKAVQVRGAFEGILIV
jgi:hypothetical protein